MSILLLTQAQENPTPPTVLPGSGAGTGRVTMTGYARTAPLGIVGEGLLAIVSYDKFVEPQLVVAILDDTLIQAPTAATVVVTGAQADTELRFYIDGLYVYSTTSDDDGNLEPTSVPVPESVDGDASVSAKGAHTLRVTQTGAAYGEATFTLQKGPAYPPRIIGPDAEPVDIPAATLPDGRRRWVLQDLRPNGLGSYVLPVNPTTMDPPYWERRLSAKHTTATSGRFHINEGAPVPVEWTFEGYCPTQEMHDQLVAFGNLNRRFYLIDHRGRAWKVTFINVDLRPRLSQKTSWSDYSWTDWGHDYTVTAQVYSQAWGVPQ